jgi:hypothetical protein
MANFLGSTFTTTGSAAFPKHIETLFDSVYLEVGGVPAQPASTSLNHIWKIFADYYLRDKESSRFLQNGSGPFASPVSNVTNAQYCVTKWTPGFITSCLPEVIHTGFLGDCVLVFRLTNNQPLVTATATTGADYQLDKLEFSCDIISLDDGGNYERMLNNLLASGNSLDITFQYWLSFSSGPTNLPAKVLGSVSAQSIDMAIVTCLPSTLVANNNYDSVTQTSDYFTRGHANITSSCLYVNNCKYPQFDPAPFECYMNSLKALNISTDTIGWLDTGLSSLQNFTNKYFTNIVRFNHNNAGEDGRWTSGTDSRGTMAQIRGELNGTGASVNAHLFLQCTGVLRIKAFRQTDVVW